MDGTEYLQKKFNKHHYHKYLVDYNTNEAVCLCGAVRGAPKVKGKNKYNAQTTFYDGYWYDSILESNYAMFLDFRVKAREIKSWDKQFPITIEYKGNKIFTTKVDFRVHNLDGSFSLVETKGFPTDVYKLQKKMITIMWIPEHPDYDYTVVTENAYHFTRA